MTRTTDETLAYLRTRYSACEAWERVSGEDLIHAPEPTGALLWVGEAWRGWDSARKRVLLVVTNGLKDTLRFLSTDDYQNGDREPQVWPELRDDLVRDMEGVEWPRSGVDDRMNTQNTTTPALGEQPPPDRR